KDKGILWNDVRQSDVCDFPASDEAIAAIRGRYTLSNNSNKTTEQYVEFRHDKKSNCITTVRKDNVVVPFTLPNKIPKDEFLFRYMSLVECERLQTVPDKYTEGVSNTQRYKMLGNGFTVDVIAHILSHIKF
ncbi:MAG: DNA cytosine methyltransferase, partial [Bacteroidales bacterium]|nr:DNA cytosine methyltransferase [Bacteroidales bacterium]